MEPSYDYPRDLPLMSLSPRRDDRTAEYGVQAARRR